MQSSIFVSYRRDDLSLAALGIYTQLRALLGPSSVFMDRTGISPGENWPDRLHNAVQEATVVLALIGSEWLRCADQYGRRRLDDPNDWVREEIKTALESKKTVIPVLLGPATNMPPGHALPDVLAALSSCQAYPMRETHWDSDLNDLVTLLVDTHGFTANAQDIQMPARLVNPTVLAEEELDQKLARLNGWDVVENPLPGQYPKFRHELRKIYQFKSFKQAVSFMSDAVEPINKYRHHPRWENQWKTVTVYLSTWDVGYKITDLDIKLAQTLDRIYKKTTQGGKDKVTDKSS
ncbi:MAG TPA: 4a-hydroxytetrahydrobiopterin dehydratase [Granulicella sp.]